MTPKCPYFQFCKQSVFDDGLCPKCDAPWPEKTREEILEEADSFLTDKQRYNKIYRKTHAKV